MKQISALSQDNLVITIINSDAREGRPYDVFRFIRIVDLEQMYALGLVAIFVLAVLVYFGFHISQ
ncbi:hypothetical protein C3941_23740 [Kaistia algarum]|nr:hypothetical protein C3941_23740 [Kaistia algarum]